MTNISQVNHTLYTSVKHSQLRVLSIGLGYGREKKKLYHLAVSPHFGIKQILEFIYQPGRITTFQLVIGQMAEFETITYRIKR